MIKEKSKRRIRHYERPLNKTSEKPKINLKGFISVIIIIAVILVKFLPLGGANSLIGSVSRTTTDYIKMINDIGKVISRHTTDKNRYLAPCSFEITSMFGERTDPVTNEPATHFGIDYAAPLFTEIKCAFDGEVSRVEVNEFYGKFIMIKHENNTETLYGHLEEALVNIGDKVKKGDIIAKSGNSGKSTGPHLHFEVRESGTPVNPEDYLL